jgi:hypothetical protein
MVLLFPSKLFAAELLAQTVSRLSPNFGLQPVCGITVMPEAHTVSVILVAASCFYLKNAPLITAFGPLVRVMLIFTWPEMFHIR